MPLYCKKKKTVAYWCLEKVSHIIQRTTRNSRINPAVTVQSFNIKTGGTSKVKIQLSRVTQMSFHNTYNFIFTKAKFSVLLY